MVLILEDEPNTAESNKIPVSESELSAVDLAVELIEVKAISRILLTACYDALQLRGLWTAINDPLALDMEKQKLRGRYKSIELGIRVAIEKANKLKK